MRVSVCGYFAVVDVSKQSNGSACGSSLDSSLESLILNVADLCNIGLRSNAVIAVAVIYRLVVVCAVLIENGLCEGTAGNLNRTGSSSVYNLFSRVEGAAFDRY